MDKQGNAKAFISLNLSNEFLIINNYISNYKIPLKNNQLKSFIKRFPLEKYQNKNSLINFIKKNPLNKRIIINKNNFNNKTKNSNKNLSQENKNILNDKNNNDELINGKIHKRGQLNNKQVTDNQNILTNRINNDNINHDEINDNFLGSLTFNISNLLFLAAPLQCYKSIYSALITFALGLCYLQGLLRFMFT